MTNEQDRERLIMHLMTADDETRERFLANLEATNERIKIACDVGKERDETRIVKMQIKDGVTEIKELSNG